MTESGRKVAVGSVLLLAAGAMLGWSYGYLERGLLAAALFLLLWQLRNLIAFERALHTGDFRVFRLGEGIWQQLFSRFRYERTRGDGFKRQHQRLIKAIRRSTDAMPDGAVILDQQNDIVSSNRAAKLLVGLKPKKDRGQRVDNIIRDPALTALLYSVDPTKTVDIQSPVQDNAWLNCRLVPYGAGQSLLIIRDVTERMRLNKMRRDFVANASHELRSPLTVICGYLDSLAEDDSVAADLRPPIVQMQRQARRMTNIVEELMQLSRVESSSRAGEGEVVDVPALLAASAKAYAGLDKSPVIELQLESSAQVFGVRADIESLIENLVSNAVRHTPQAGHVGLHWQTNETGGELLVRDDGEGIAAEHIPRLTERFFRVDRGRAREDGGIGLGLAIVKHVLQRHDAELHIRSVPGQGSEFRCHFPPARIAVSPGTES